MIRRLFRTIYEWFDRLIFGEVVAICCNHCSFKVNPDEDDEMEKMFLGLTNHYCFSNPGVREFTMWSRRFLFYYQAYTLTPPPRDTDDRSDH